MARRYHSTMRSLASGLLLALACADSDPTPPSPPSLGGGPPSVSPGERDGAVATDGGGEALDAAAPSLCLEVTGGPADANRLFVTYGDLALDFRLGLVVAEWVTPVNCAATPRLRVSLAREGALCTAAGSDRLTFVIDAPGDFPNATSSTVTLADEAPAVTARYRDSGDSARPAATYGNCLGASGVITYDAMDLDAGLKAAVFDLDLTRCDGEPGVILGATGAFEFFMPTAFRDVCTP